MSTREASDALSRGCDLAIDEIRNGADIVAIGEMGIGNTASSALIMHRLAPAPLEQCIGAGAGQNEEGFERKRAALNRAAQRTQVSSPFDALVEFSGFEIAMMAGAVIGAASLKRPILIDGFIASTAALVAIRMWPVVRGYCVFAHRSAERGHGILLDSLNAQAGVCAMCAPEDKRKSNDNQPEQAELNPRQGLAAADASRRGSLGNRGKRILAPNSFRALK
jgi:nicotinate-nucleotide--dimethylbenzimidazole phosphoribosyltransferase